MTSSQPSLCTHRLLRRATRFGVLVAGPAIILMAIQNNLFEGRITLRTHVASLAGMPANAPVRLNGILIGSIDKVLLSTTHDQFRGVEVDMRIYKRFLDHIPVDSIASIYDTPGDKYLSITRGSDPKHIDPNGEVQSMQTIER